MELKEQAKYFEGWRGFLKILLIISILATVYILISSGRRDYFIKNPYEITTIVLGGAGLIWYLIRKMKIKFI